MRCGCGGTDSYSSFSFDCPTRVIAQIVAHTGGLPGISTLVAFLPDDGLGVVALANADEKASVNQEILLRIVEDVMGLPRTRAMNTADAK